MSARGEHGLSVIVRTVTRLTSGLVFLYGLHIVLNGHLSPGGGFAGGVIIALAFTGLVLAFGSGQAAWFSSRTSASILESLGALMFVSIALLGYGWGGFFDNFLPAGTPFRILSAGTIPLCNIAICLKVGAGLSGIFLTLIILMRSEKPGTEGK